MALLITTLLLLPVPALAENHDEAEAAMVEIRFQIGSTIYTVNGEPREMDVAPRIDPTSERTLLPVRYVADAMGAAVSYQPEGQRIALVHPVTRRLLDLSVSGRTMLVYDVDEAQPETVTLDQAPVIDPPGRTMLPVRAVVEALGGQIAYDPAARIITIIREATPAAQAVSPAQVHFGSTVAHNPEEPMHSPYLLQETVTVTNLGQGPLMVESALIEGDEVFSLCGVPFEPFMLAPGEIHSLIVCAEPMRPGSFQGLLTFDSSVEFADDLLLQAVPLFLNANACSVEIVGGGEKPNPATSGFRHLPALGIDRPLVNSGQHIGLEAKVSGGTAPFSYHWAVQGMHIKDYTETVASGWSTTAMQPADYDQQAISFYWKQVGKHMVSLTVIDANQQVCTAQEIFEVERNNNDIDRQAEDFYVWNHGSQVLSEHLTWHQTYRFGWNPGETPTRATFNGCKGPGTRFYTFHHDFVARFNSWRTEFGYPALAVWDPGTPFPRGISVDHNGRNNGYVPRNLPSYFTAAGGLAPSPCSPAGAPRLKRSDFPNSDAFWVIFEGWHNGVHGAIGGDMGNPGLAPKDPIFWRWHTFVDRLGNP